MVAPRGGKASRRPRVPCVRSCAGTGPPPAALFPSPHSEYVYTNCAHHQTRRPAEPRSARLHVTVYVQQRCYRSTRLDFVQGSISNPSPKKLNNLFHIHGHDSPGHKAGEENAHWHRLSVLEDVLARIKTPAREVGARAITIVRRNSSASRHAQPNDGSDNRTFKVRYVGKGCEYAEVLCSKVSGGQIVLSQAAWDSMGAELPAGTIVLHLGEHQLSDHYSEVSAFMELVPQFLANRKFAPIKDAMASSHSLGYHDTPEPTEKMAIMFVSTSAPHFDDPQLVRNTADAIPLFCSELRRLLHQYDGYECKEPEPGKFTLCFRTFEGAVTFSARLHTDLMAVPWPADVLTAPNCSEMLQDGVLLYRGLRAKIGIAFGVPMSRKPLHSGRAGMPPSCIPGADVPGVSPVPLQMCQG